MQILTTLGITPSTSIIGVVLALAVSRLPFRFCRSFRSIHVQNLAQTNISSATFGAANSLLLPIGVPALLGRQDLILPMLTGATMGMLIDLAMLYWFFDSRLFPGSAPWPPGVAAAEAIRAGDEGGTRAGLLGAGAAAGILGSSGLLGLMRAVAGWQGISMSALGIAWIGNPGSILFLGLGLLAGGYSRPMWGIDAASALVPHGVMVGAGTVALLQALQLILRRPANTLDPGPFTRSDGFVRRSILKGLGLYLLAALVLALMSSLHGEMSGAQLAAWIVFAAVASVAAEFIVGFSAMRAGWFPAFGTALIFLILGIAAGFPPVATGLLVGFVASGGPAFADAGYDLKAGWDLRGRGQTPGWEMQGRKQQIYSGLIGLLTGLVMVVLFHQQYFMRDLFPPADRVFVATVRSGVDPSLLRNLFLWAIPGVIIQVAGGSNRQLGILFATGLMVANPVTGWVVCFGVGSRLAWETLYPDRRPVLTVLGAGCIAGAALWEFGSSLPMMRP